MKCDALIVGGGMAGLTSAAYPARAGFKTVLCEKENTCGGLVKTIERNGFFYDAGIRAMENSGVIFPMIRQLGLDIDFIKNHVTIGIEDKVIQIQSEESIEDYRALLVGLYPESGAEIDAIVVEIKKIMHYMEVQYGIDNPVFLDMKKDRDYMMKKILPWMFKYALTAPRIASLSEPVEDFLNRFSRNQQLLDIIMQHFFHQTPAFFALSYLKLFLEYYYPRGGTGQFVKELVSFIEAHQGKIMTGIEIKKIDPEKRIAVDQHGNDYAYEKLIWAADLKSFYRMIDMDAIRDGQVKGSILARRDLLADKAGNDSVLTLFLAVDKEKSYFSRIASEHFFYTPVKEGITAAGPIPLNAGWEEIKAWVTRFLELTTFEISIPVLRDDQLAPPGKTGLIISTLFDYKLTKYIEEKGWSGDFTKLVEACIITVLSRSIFSEITGKILHQFSSTPLTIARIAGTTDGAITGWAFSNHPMPAESRIPKIMNAIKTPVPNVFQAGQWTYSPSGLPISILTGKLAADQVIKELGRLPAKSD